MVEHLLLAARQRAGGLRLPRLEDREQVEQPIQTFGPILLGGGAGRRVEILAHAHIGEEFAPLRRLHDAGARDRGRGLAAQRGALRRMSPA